MIFNITSGLSVGCTFVDWSIHYLTGQQEFYNTKLGLTVLSKNPIKDLNSHGHLKNHPSGLERVQLAFSILKNSPLPLNSFYATPTWYKDACKINSENPARVIQESIRDIIDFCNEVNVPTILIHSPYIPGYYNTLRSLIKNNIPVPNTSSIEDSQYLFYDFFFHNSKSNFESNIWGRREFIAVNIRPYDHENYESLINYTDSVLSINAKDIWLNGEYSLIKIIDFLELTVDKNRLQTWRPIYTQWSNIHTEILNFCENLDHIVHCIINDIYLDLTQYNLNLIREAIIQHIVMYKHNKNFKIFGLEKFPTNTKDLHNLLKDSTI